MSQAAQDDLDALLASLMVGPESEPVVELAPVVALLPHELSIEAIKIMERTRAWLDVAEPGATLQPIVLDPPAREHESLEPEILLELVAARAWRHGDLAAFHAALARLPADRAEHHRRMASMCDLIKARQETGAEARASAPRGRS